jgi:hypothetical protein
VKEVSTMITMTGSGIAMLVVAVGALIALAVHAGAHHSD